MNKISSDFLEKLKNGDKRTIARGITYVELNDDISEELLKSVHADLGNAYK